MTYLEERIVDFIKKKGDNGNMYFKEIPANKNTLRGIIGSLVKKNLISYDVKSGLITLK